MKKVIRVIRTFGGVKNISDEHWESTEIYCPNCGEQKVWMLDDGGDYYVGEDHICIGCGVMFTWQNEMNMSEERTPQLIKQLS